ncbi:MAG: HDOD domain-containing protein [Saccharospirillum sp.]|uniref:HDOD domain-containing protein n=1 Tax=Saccharospirillum sp. TaxID=2033801 RepID=UPI003296D863
MNPQDPWLERIKAVTLPALLPQTSLPGPSAPLMDWIKVVSEDPLLAMLIFRYANRMMSNRQVLVRTLEHAVALIGSQRLIKLTESIPRLDPASTAFSGLQSTVGDSLVAASLMRQWFEMRQIPWTEADYWMTLFYDVGLWALWLLEPQMMDGFEFRAERGENRNKLIEGMIGMSVRDWNDELCRHFQLPAIPETNTNEENEHIENRIQPHKLSALKFFLPFSHELAYQVRQNWESEQLDTLFRTGEIALGLTEFRPMLKTWITSAAREYQLPQAATAARRLLAHQPPVSTQGAAQREGFSEADRAWAEEISKTYATPHTHNESPAKPSSKPVAAKQPAKKTRTESESNAPDDTTYRHSVNLNSLREVRRQFRNQKTWHSPVEIQESALFCLQQSLGLHRIVVMEHTKGQWQAFDHEGCDHYLLLKHLKLPITGSSALQEFSRRVTAAWLRKDNRTRARKQLPDALFKAADDQDFFLRSFSIGREVTMMIYADAKGDPEPLGESDYRLFREFCADWNTALNRIRQ